MSPFTKDVLQSLEFLRQAIGDVTKADADLGDTLTAIVDDLVINLENQMMLVFSNVGLKRKQEQEDLLRARSDMSLLEQYRTACADNASVSIDGRTNKIKVASQHDPVPIVHSLPNDVPRELLDHSVQRTLLTAIHLTLESVGHVIGAERVILYVAQKGTGTLRVISCAPDVTLARRGAFLAAHQGIVGSVFCTGIGVRADHPTPEVRTNFIDNVDAQLGLKTHNVMAFPVVDKNCGTPVAVLECANKSVSFSEEDELFVAQVCRVLWYQLCYHEVDFHNGMVFNPAALHAARPYRAEVSADLQNYHGAASVGHRQLVVRLRSVRKPNAIEQTARALGLQSPEGDVPSAVKGRGQVLADAVEVDSLGKVRELNSYLSKVEDAHRHIMAELVVTQEREAALREEASKKAYKIRLLEDNTQALHDQLSELKQSLNKSSFAPMSDANANDFEPPALTTFGSFLKRDKLPAITADASVNDELWRSEVRSIKSPNVVVRSTTEDPHAVLAKAARALQELRTITANAHVPVLNSRTFLTPQPSWRGSNPKLRPLSDAQREPNTSPAAQYVHSKRLAQGIRKRADL